MLQEKDLENLALRRKKSRRAMIVIVTSVFASAALIGLGFWGWQAYTGSHAGDNKKNIEHVHRGSIDVRISATGTIRPYNQVKLSPKFTGLLKVLNVQQGDQVHKGQIVALMDDSNLAGQVQAATGAYQAAQANYEKALHGSRPQEVADAEAQYTKSQSMVRFYNMALSRAKADVASSTAQLKRDETNASRLVQLSSQGAVSDQEGLNATTQAEVSVATLEKSRQDLKQAEASLAQSKSDLESSAQRLSMWHEGMRKEDVRAYQQAAVQAEGNMKFLQSQLNDTMIKAPFDGVVTQKYADQGAIVTPTTSAATTSATSSSIISLAGRLEMVAAVSETDIENIQPGQKVEIVASAYPGRVFHGHVTLIAPEAIVNQNVTTFEVHAQIDDDARHKLMSGMNVNSEFIAGRKENVLLIPTVSVVSKKGKVGVFIPDKNGNPEFKAVGLGITSESETAITKGLKEGDPVFLGLNKEQLIEQGYNDKNMSTSGGRDHKPEIPRGLRNKL